MSQAEDRELDIAIAAIHGWKWDDESAEPPCGSCKYARRYPASDPWAWLPYYSTNMSDAWLVVEKLVAEGYKFTISNDLEQYPSVGNRFVMVEPRLWRCVIGIGSRPMVTEVSTYSLPSAICNAIILSKGVPVAT